MIVVNDTYKNKVNETKKRIFHSASRPIFVLLGVAISEWTQKSTLVVFLKVAFGRIDYKSTD